MIKTDAEFYTWDEDGVCDWLRTLIYEEQVVQLFKENAVNGELLPDLTDELLKEEVGIKAPEMRNKILGHIQNLVEGIPPPPNHPQKFFPGMMMSRMPMMSNPTLQIQSRPMDPYNMMPLQFSPFNGAPPPPLFGMPLPPPPPSSPPPRTRKFQRRKRNEIVAPMDVNKKPRIVYKCTVQGCPKEFHVEGWLRIHLEAHRLGKVTVMKCPLCSMTFVENERLRVHYEEHSNLRTIKCEFCDRKFAERRHLERHLTTHADMKPFRCPVANCNAAFSTRGAIRDHRKSHPEMRTCHICHAVVSDERYLKTHVMGVHGAQRWPCRHPGCDKTYSTKQALALHARKHGEKRFHCDQCDKSFHYIRELKYHITKEHTEKKPFSCTYCNMSFDVIIDLNSHMRVHTGDMIPCSKCKMKFTKTEKLKLHMEIAHDSLKDTFDCDDGVDQDMDDEAQEQELDNVPQFNCPGCEQTFSTTNSLDNHIRQVHGEDGSDEDSDGRNIKRIPAPSSAPSISRSVAVTNRISAPTRRSGPGPVLGQPNLPEPLPADVSRIMTDGQAIPLPSTLPPQSVMMNHSIQHYPQTSFLPHPLVSGRQFQPVMSLTQLPPPVTARPNFSHAGSMNSTFAASIVKSDGTN